MRARIRVHVRLRGVRVLRFSGASLSASSFDAAALAAVSASSCSSHAIDEISSKSRFASSEVLARKHATCVWVCACVWARGCVCMCVRVRV